MNEKFESTRVAAYYIWDRTQCDDALALWYAVEDIATFFKKSNILNAAIIGGIKEIGKEKEAYRWFIRHIAYRIYIYTGNEYELENWFLAEYLVESEEWIEQIIQLANLI